MLDLAAGYSLAMMAPMPRELREEPARAFGHIFRVAEAAGFTRDDIV